MIKNFLERITFLGTLSRRRRYKRFEQKYIEWQENGAVLPMPHLGKQRVVLEYTAKFKPSMFVETGTYTGHMVYAMLNKFKEIYTMAEEFFYDATYEGLAQKLTRLAGRIQQGPLWPKGISPALLTDWFTWPNLAPRYDLAIEQMEQGRAARADRP